MARFCNDCIAMSLHETSGKSNERIVLRLTVTAERVPNGVAAADVYLAWLKPDGEIHFIHVVSNWSIADMRQEHTIDALAIRRETGQHHFYFALVRVGAAPLDERNWIAFKRAEMVVLPQDRQISRRHAVNSDSTRRAGQALPGILPQFVAHGGAEVAGQRVTNTLQALNAAYDRGQRLIEVDFSWTSDRHLVLLHDWHETYWRLFVQPAGRSGVPDRDTFNHLTMHHGLTQLNLEQLLAWLRERPDAVIITDIKAGSAEGLAVIAQRAGKQIRQFVPQIYRMAEYRSVRALGYERIIFTLYRTDIADGEILNFAASHRLMAVTMPANRVVTGTLARRLAQQGVWVYAHTVNRIDFFDYLRGRGVSGIYSDVLYSETLFESSTE